MSTGAAFGGSSPRRLVGGQPRRQVERWQLAVSLIPGVIVAVVSFAGLGMAVAHGPVTTVTAAVVVCVVGYRTRRRLGSMVARPWWRFEWRWAARSAGLARLAELDIDATHTPAEATVEVVPVLYGVDRLADGRRYRVRPLAGQTLTDFERAAPSLMIRWRMDTVTVTRGTGRWGRGQIILTALRGETLNTSPSFDG